MGVICFNPELLVSHIEGLRLKMMHLFMSWRDYLEISVVFDSFDYSHMIVSRMYLLAMTYFLAVA